MADEQTMSDLVDFLAKIRSIQSVMVLVSTGQAGKEEKEAEYQELCRDLKNHFSAHSLTNPNHFSSLKDFYGYYRSRLPTYQERRDFIGEMYGGIEHSIESALKKGGRVYIGRKNMQIPAETPKILFLAANPKNAVKLRLDEEAREIDQKIMLAQKKDHLELVNKGAVRIDDLLLYLNQERPTVVHFCGHGTDEGKIVLEDNLGNAVPVPPQALAKVFEVLKDKIRCVVLNACFSSEQAQAISRHIDCVVGMSSSITDKAAIVFSSAFYLAIASEKSLKEAFDQGIAALMLWGIPEEHAPQLLSRDGVNPSGIFLLTHPTGEDEKSLLLNRIKEDLELIKKDLVLDLKDEAFQRHEFLVDVFENLQKDLVREVNTTTFRAIQETYVKISQLRFLSNLQDFNRRSYKEAIEAIDRTLKMLE